MPLCSVLARHILAACLQQTAGLHALLLACPCGQLLRDPKFSSGSLLGLRQT